MPPKSILPIRRKGSSPLMLVIFPGTAKHICSHATPLLPTEQRLLPRCASRAMNCLHSERWFFLSAQTKPQDFQSLLRASLNPAAVARLQGRFHLAQANSPVVGRNTLLPVRMKAFLGQTPNRAFSEISILKTAA